MIDMRMYKYPDYRCLKPKPGLPSSQWPHYDMEQHRAAKSPQELDKVEEIPFDKESLSLYYLTEKGKLRVKLKARAYIIYQLLFT